MSSTGQTPRRGKRLRLRLRIMISIGSVWTLLKLLEKLRRRHLRILLGLRKISSPT